MDNVGIENVGPTVRTSVTQESGIKGHIDTVVAVERFRDMPIRDQVGHWLGGAQEIIKEKRNEGFFNDQTRPQAEKGLLYKGGDVNPESSQSLEAVLDSLKLVGGEEATATYEAIAKYVKVKIAEGDTEKLYILDEWQEKLAQATPEEGVRLKGEGLYGFVFPEESQQDQPDKQAQLAQEKSPEEIEIAKAISEYREFFEKRVKAQGGNPSEEDMQTFVMLSFGQAANGEAGVIFKREALKNLAEERGVQNLESKIGYLEQQMSNSISKVSSLMENQGKAELAKEFGDAVKNGNLMEVIERGKLTKVEGMRELIFGKDFKEEDLNKLLDLGKKNKWKSPLLLALAIMLGAVVEFGKEVEQVVERPS